MVAVAGSLHRIVEIPAPILPHEAEADFLLAAGIVEPGDDPAQGPPN